MSETGKRDFLGLSVFRLSLDFIALFYELDKLGFSCGTGGETRTRKGLPPVDFESTASTIPPLRREESFLVKPYFKVNRILGRSLCCRRILPDHLWSGDRTAMTL